MARHDYEERQSFNALVRFLHSVRFKTLEGAARGLKPAYGARLRVLDIGCGPASAYPVLTKLRQDIEYVGVELREDFCALARERYGGEEGFAICQAGIGEQLDLIERCDLILGLESFEHILEPEVEQVVETIGRAEFQKLLITVPNELGPAIVLKNVGSLLMGYMRHKEYRWRDTYHAAIYAADKLPPHTNGHIGFDWRWLERTLRQHVEVSRITTSPWPWVPRALSPSIGFLCERR